MRVFFSRPYQIVNLVGLPPPDLLNVIPPHVRAMYFASSPPKGHWTLRDPHGGGDVSTTTCGTERTHAEVCAALQDRLRAHGLGDTGRRRTDDDHGPDDYARFVDLLARLLHADPTQRLSPRAALCATPSSRTRRRRRLSPRRHHPYCSLDPS